MDSILKPYIAWACDDPAEGAALVWAYSARQARKIAHPWISGWLFPYVSYIDVRAKRLRKHADYLETLRQSDEPHVMDDVPVCPACELWGAPRVGDGCANCLESPDGCEGACNAG